MGGRGCRERGWELTHFGRFNVFSFLSVAYFTNAGSERVF